MIQEHERAVLTAEVPDEGLKPGDIGTLIHVYGQQEAFEVEFVALDGETVAIVTLSADKVRQVSHHEIPHARLLAS